MGAMYHIKKRSLALELRRIDGTIDLSHQKIDASGVSTAEIFVSIVPLDPIGWLVQFPAKTVGVLQPKTLFRQHLPKFGQHLFHNGTAFCLTIRKKGVGSPLSSNMSIFCSPKRS